MSKSIKYFINEKEKVVVAVMEDTTFDVENLLFSKRVALPSIFYDKEAYWLKDKYVGIARCHEDDEFDLFLGKEIAKKRLLFNYYEDFTKKLYRYKKDVNERIENICRKPCAHLDNIVNNMVELEDIVNKV